MSLLRYHALNLKQICFSSGIAEVIRLLPGFLYKACGTQSFFFFFPPAIVKRSKRASMCCASASVCIHLLCFWPVNCNQISSLHEATEMTLLRFSSRAPPCDLPPPSPLHLQRASWPHELMSKWHLEIMNVADHREDAERMDRNSRGEK